LVGRRHAQFASNLPPEFQQHVIDTTLPRTENQEVVRGLIWETLTGWSMSHPRAPRSFCASSARRPVADRWHDGSGAGFASPMRLPLR
jgi:hypothetical protein